MVKATSCKLAAGGEAVQSDLSLPEWLTIIGLGFAALGMAATGVGLATSATVLFVASGIFTASGAIAE